MLGLPEYRNSVAKIIPDIFYFFIDGWNLVGLSLLKAKIDLSFGREVPETFMKK